MKPVVTLLLSSAGRRVGLLECFRSDALALGLDLRIIATDLRPELSAACAVADASFASPACDQPEYASFLRDLCRRENVDVVVPTIDTELLPLSALEDSLAAAGTRIAISTKDTITLARNKLKTALELSQIGARTPRTIKLADFDPDDVSWTWPLIVKPIDGSSSIGLRIISREEFRTQPFVANLIMQELLVGREYTVNMFFNREGMLKCAIPHLRMETRAGEVSKGETARHAALEEIAWRLGKVLRGARGPLCFQAIVSPDGIPSLFEINARFGGGYPLAHAAGARFTQWLLEEVAGLHPSAGNDWRSGVRMLRYDAAVFS